MRKTYVRDGAYIALSAAVIAVCSWISIPTAVPFTMQTFAVFVTSGLLGAKRGMIALAVYLLLGAIGLPVFSSGTAGVGVLTGPTGGYLLGFFPTALIVGCARGKFGLLPWKLAAAMAAGLLVCYAFGTAFFVLVYTRTRGAITFGAALSMCVLPFLIPDAAKIALAVPVVIRLSRALKY